MQSSAPAAAALEECEGETGYNFTVNGNEISALDGSMKPEYVLRPVKIMNCTHNIFALAYAYFGGCGRACG